MEILKDKIPKHIFQRIESAEIYDLDYFLSKPIKEICDKIRVGPKDARNLISLVSEIVLTNNFITVDDLQCNTSQWATLKFGCSKIDETLRGIPVRGITELYGASGSGKTQLALHLSLKVQEEEGCGGLNGGTVYICTESIFPSKRLNEMCGNWPKCRENQNYMDHVFVEHIQEIDQLKQLITLKLPILLSRTKIKLIVIDSIAAIFRYDNEAQDYITRGEDLLLISTKLNSLSQHYNLALICINQVTANMTSGSRPCLGLSWSNLVRLRIKVARTRNNITIANQVVPVRNLKIIFSPNLPVKQCTFIVTKRGIEDFCE